MPSASSANSKITSGTTGRRSSGRLRKSQTAGEGDTLRRIDSAVLDSMLTDVEDHKGGALPDPAYRGPSVSKVQTRVRSPPPLSQPSSKRTTVSSSRSGATRTGHGREPLASPDTAGMDAPLGSQGTVSGKRLSLKGKHKASSLRARQSPSRMASPSIDDTTVVVQDSSTGVDAAFDSIDKDLVGASRDISRASSPVKLRASSPVKLRASSPAKRLVSIKRSSESPSPQGTVDRRQRVDRIKKRLRIDSPSDDGWSSGRDNDYDLNDPFM
ncbi:hypothetical protein BKA70DRAFT_1447129 [Coprinopsis sp. MPI-PUGE-AT-0042]|nr:hypothetical protein BKA70DRAFT_1447129 [Coprinopsis sp. MPI-PUGE-AT-0042]